MTLIAFHTSILSIGSSSQKLVGAEQLTSTRDPKNHQISAVLLQNQGLQPISTVGDQMLIFSLVWEVLKDLWMINVQCIVNLMRFLANSPLLPDFAALSRCAASPTERQNHREGDSPPSSSPSSIVNPSGQDILKP